MIGCGLMLRSDLPTSAFGVITGSDLWCRRPTCFTPQPLLFLTVAVLYLQKYGLLSPTRPPLPKICE
jgi:hypothetical protein